MREADWRLSKNPNDVDALFARAWVRSLRCTYVAMVERAFATGFRLATKAKDDAERALQFDPGLRRRKADRRRLRVCGRRAPLAVQADDRLCRHHRLQIHRARAAAKTRANRGVITSVEARTAIALFLRREARYREAIDVVRGLKNEYPHDFLFCLEEANLRKDAGEGMKAVDAYREVLADAAKPGYFASSKLELADFGLGDALRGQRHYD